MTLIEKKKIFNASSNEYLKFQSFHFPNWPKGTFSSQDWYIFMQKGNEKKEKYLIRDTVWFNTKFSVLKIEVMSCRPYDKLSDTQTGIMEAGLLTWSFQYFLL